MTITRAALMLVYALRHTPGHVAVRVEGDTIVLVTAGGTGCLREWAGFTVRNERGAS